MQRWLAAALAHSVCSSEHGKNDPMAPGTSKWGCVSLAWVGGLRGVLGSGVTLHSARLSGSLLVDKLIQFCALETYTLHQQIAVFPETSDRCQHQHRHHEDPCCSFNACPGRRRRGSGSLLRRASSISTHLWAIAHTLTCISTPATLCQFILAKWYRRLWR
jgi:hypothetical protein